jgi:hypothetical protein
LIENGAPESPTKEELHIIMKKAGSDGSIKFMQNINTFNREILLKPHDVVFIELCSQI